MVSTSIPELHSLDDLDHLRESLKLGASDAEADSHFETLIVESLNFRPHVLHDVLYYYNYYNYNQAPAPAPVSDTRILDYSR